MSAPPWEPSVIRWLREVHAGGVCAVTGMPRTGKSRVLKAADGRVWSRRLVFDPYAKRDRRLYQLGESPAPPWPGTWCSTDDLRKHAREILDWDPLRVVVVPSSLDPQTLGDEFTACARVLWATGRIDLIAEEAGLYSRWAVPLVMQLASGGGHAAMRLWLVSQSITRLAVDARRHVSHLVSFAQGSPEDIDATRERAGRRFADAVRKLRPGMGPALWRLGDET